MWDDDEEEDGNWEEMDGIFTGVDPTSSKTTPPVEVPKAAVPTPLKGSMGKTLSGVESLFGFGVRNQQVPERAQPPARPSAAQAAVTLEAPVAPVVSAPSAPRFNEVPHEVKVTLMKATPKAMATPKDPKAIQPDNDQRKRKNPPQQQEQQQKQQKLQPQQQKKQQQQQQQQQPQKQQKQQKQQKLQPQQQKKQQQQQQQQPQKQQKKQLTKTQKRRQQQRRKWERKLRQIQNGAASNGSTAWSEAAACAPPTQQAQPAPLLGSVSYSLRSASGRRMVPPNGAQPNSFSRKSCGPGSTLAQQATQALHDSQVQNAIKTAPWAKEAQAQPAQRGNSFPPEANGASSGAPQGHQPAPRNKAPQVVPPRVDLKIPWVMPGSASGSRWSSEATSPQSLPERFNEFNDARSGHKDCFGRDLNLRAVVVNFANIGHSYGSKVLRIAESKGMQMFDWEGVRRCVRFLKAEQRMKVTGVIPENFKGFDNRVAWVAIPKDIEQMCETVEETPRVTGRNHSSADDEMTIKCAYRRACCFLDNDNYQEWMVQLRDDKARTWLQEHRELVHLRYYFDAGLGTFDLLSGNYPVTSLALNETCEKRNLSRMGRA